MPAPVSYIDIPAAPFSRTVTQAEFNGGTFGGTANVVWFRYVAAAAVTFGTFTDVGGTFVPRMRLYADASGAMTLVASSSDPAVSHGFSFALTAGETYWLEVRNNHPSHVLGTSDFDFTTIADTSSVQTSVPYGSIVINDDAAGFPATVFTPSGTFLGYISGVPAGETGQTLPSGLAVVHDRYGSVGAPLSLFSAGSFAPITSVDTSPSTVGQFPIFAHDSTKFWVVDRSHFPAPVYELSAAGVLSAQVASLSPNDKVSAVGVSPAGTILYWAEGSTANSTAIHRHDLGTDTPLSDLYDVTGLSGSIALTGVNNHPGDILVLSDGSIVTWYRDDGAGNKDVLIHLSAAGSLLQSYDYAHPIRLDHLSPSPDDPAAVRVWFFLDNTASRGRFQNLTIATGTPTVTFDTDLFSEGENLVAGGTQLFGPSSSCVMLTAGFGETGTIRVDKVTVPDASPQSFDFTAGALFPATFSLVDGGSQTFDDVVAGDGYSVTETPVAGWSTSITVSNGSPPENIAVAAGETVVVTVTNTQTPPPVPPTEGNDCCATSGPGGGSGENGPGGYPPKTDPRVVPPGGAPPEYITCNAGGGLPEFAEDPADLSDLATCTVPRVYLQWRLRDGSMLRLGEFGFTSHRGPVTARVTSWGPVKQVLADRFGAFQANHFTVRLSDTDRAIRALLTAAATKYIDGTEIEVLIEADGGAPRVLARAVVSDYSFNADLSVDLTCTDPLGYKYSSVSLDRPLPRRTLRRELFPTLPEESSGKPAPIVYGIYSDDYTWLLNPNRIPVGILPIHYVGAPSSIPGLEGAPGDHAFAIAGHALSCVQSVFASNLGKDVDGETDVPYGSVRMFSSLFGSEFFVPGIDLPLYHDITGSDGITERFAFLTVAEGSRVRDHLNGRVPITINALGVEDVGDGSGNTITSLTYQFLHFLCQWVLQDYRTGPWLPVPRFADGTPKVRTSSFQDVVDIQTARMGAPYEGAMYLGEHKPGRAWNTAWQISGDMRHGVNHQGQSLVTTLNDTGDTDTLQTFTDVDHVVDASFTVEPKPEEIANIFTYEAGPEAATKRVGVVAKTIRNLTSIANHDEREAQALTYEATRHPPTADDVANRTLVRTADAPTEVFFATNLRAAALQLGQLIRMKHYQGIGPFGWTDRVLLVTGVQTMPDADQFACEVECEDVHDILEAGQDVFVIDEALIDEARIG